MEVIDYPVLFSIFLIFSLILQITSEIRILIFVPFPFLEQGSRCSVQSAIRRQTRVAPRMRTFQTSLHSEKKYQRSETKSNNDGNSKMCGLNLNNPASIKPECRDALQDRFYVSYHLSRITLLKRAENLAEEMKKVR